MAFFYHTLNRSCVTEQYHVLEQTLKLRKGTHERAWYPLEHIEPNFAPASLWAMNLLKPQGASHMPDLVEDKALALQLDQEAAADDENGPIVMPQMTCTNSGDNHPVGLTKY